MKISHLSIHRTFLEYALLYCRAEKKSFNNILNRLHFLERWLNSDLSQVSFQLPKRYANFLEAMTLNILALKDPKNLLSSALPFLKKI